MRLAGHPLHPTLVHFPIALWTMGLGCDGAGWISGSKLGWTLGFWSQLVGTAFGVLALASGALELTMRSLPSPAQRSAIWHALAMGTAWCFFLLALAFRGGPEGAASPVAVATAALGFLIMVIGGWLGGQLVYRYGVGVTRIEPQEAVAERAKAQRKPYLWPFTQTKP